MYKEGNGVEKNRQANTLFLQASFNVSQLGQSCWADVGAGCVSIGDEVPLTDEILVAKNLVVVIHKFERRNFTRNGKNDALYYWW